MNMQTNGSRAEFDAKDRPAFIDFAAEIEAAADEHFAAEMKALARYRRAAADETSAALASDARAVLRIAAGVTVGILLGSLAADLLIAHGLWPVVEVF